MNQYYRRLLDLFKYSSFPTDSPKSAHNIIGDKNVILYGAGDGFFTFFASKIKDYPMKITAILDKKFTKNTYFHGLPAYSPNKYKPTISEKNNSIVIITAGKRQYHKKIFSTIKKMGFKHAILATDIYEYHFLFPSETLKEEGFNYYLNNRKEIFNCLNLFEDDLSRDIFIKCLETHMLKKIIDIPMQPIEELYYPKDIQLNKGYSRYVDCGAYNGDTVKKLYRQIGTFDALVCFEPNLKHYDHLISYLMNQKHQIAKELIVFPCGVYNREKKIAFIDNDRINSRITKSNSNSNILCVALDHALPNFRPTFIKMNIEGSELKALEGAKMLLTKFKPDLAISAYHSPDDIWNIPLYLRSLKIGYKFYLRNYSSFVTETVLYATT